MNMKRSPFCWARHDIEIRSQCKRLVPRFMSEKIFTNSPLFGIAISIAFRLTGFDNPPYISRDRFALEANLWVDNFVRRSATHGHGGDLLRSRMFENLVRGG